MHLMHKTCNTEQIVANSTTGPVGCQGHLCGTSGRSSGRNQRWPVGLMTQRRSSVSKSELPPHVPIVVVGLKRQIQPVVRSEITYQVAKLHDPLVGQPCFPQLRNLLIRDGGGIPVDLQRKFDKRPEPSIRNCSCSFHHKLPDLTLVGL